MSRSGIRHPRSTCLSRTSALAASTTLLSVAVLTGCGGSDSDDTATDVTRGSAVKPLSAAELDKASLSKADLSGYTVGTPGDAEVVTDDQVKVSDDTCGPLGRAVFGVALGKPDATTYRRVTGRPDTKSTSANAAADVNTGMVTLASYAGADEAATALKSAGAAVADCADGFGLTVQGEKFKASKVTGNTAPKAGDEAVAYTVTIPTEGTDVPWKVVLFRSGATLAHFTLANGASAISGKDFTFPTDLVTAQAGKLT